MSFPSFFRRLFDNGGKGPMLRPDIVPFQKRYRSEKILFGPVAAGTEITVPSYVVGDFELQLFANGLHLDKDYDYIEVGIAGETSNKVILTTEILGGGRLTVCADSVIETGDEPAPEPGEIVISSTSETILNKTIVPGTICSVPLYTVGLKQLGLYVDGAFCRLDDTYSEVGNVGESSNLIEFKDRIDPGSTVIVFKADSHKERLLTDPISTGDVVAVDQYIVGKAQIQVFVDGVLCKRGDVWQEVGNSGEASTSIKFNVSLEETRDVLVVITSGNCVEQDVLMPIAAESTVTVPEYKVGSGELRVYADGVLCGNSNAYSEVGDTGAVSTTIKFNDAVSTDYPVLVVVEKGA